jgi:tetratricopeptide (TPR) repeat protein
MDDKEETANNYYTLALQSAKSISSDSINPEGQDQLYSGISTTNITLPTNTTDYSTILGNIADIYYKQQDYPKALDFYKRAFSLATDQHCCHLYQQMILTLSKKM